jgi:hypothetical protein
MYSSAFNYQKKHSFNNNKKTNFGENETHTYTHGAWICFPETR